MSVASAVCVTGMGIVSPLGHSIEEVTTRLAAGETAVAALLDHPRAYGASVTTIPFDSVAVETRSRLGRLDRFCRLLLSAAFSAVRSAHLEIAPDAAERVGIVVGTGLGCLLTNAEFNQKLVDHGASAASPRLFAYTVSSAAAGELSIALGIKGPNVTLHQGFAAGLSAVAHAADLIRMGKADVVLAAGVDALGPPLIHALAKLGVLKREEPGASSIAALAGIAPSEGAAVLVLESQAHARNRDATVLAHIAGYAAGFEPTLTHHDRQPTAIRQTLQTALSRSALTAQQVGLVVTSQHAPALEAVERIALEELFPSQSFLSPKQAWGECFAAHGALATALAIELMKRRQAHNRHADAVVAADTAPFALVHSLCYSGPTVALLVSGAG